VVFITLVNESGYDDNAWVSMFLRTGYGEIVTIHGGVKGRCIIFLILIMNLCCFLLEYWSYGTLEGFIYLFQP